MPPRDKDKLLFRLIAKDYDLVQQLEFKLLEGSATVEERREEIKEEIKLALIESKRYFYSPGYLLLDLRSLSGKINFHVKTTKDKYGEIELNFFMLNHALELMSEQIRPFSAVKSRTLNEYIVRRTLKLLKLLDKLHDDYRLDFNISMKHLGKSIGNLPNLMRTAIKEMLDVNWLLKGKWPSN